MFNKDTHVVRGDSERQVELKAKEFIYVRDTVHDEEWEAEPAVKTPARLVNWKPWSIVLNRVPDDV
ncbi:hypothetical protein PODOV005v1_10017 [Vibrio phage PS32B.2]|nr:hypothetical protein PODOV005v1_10017 [Vibrio phage PS32B.2]QZI86319.1 hypothetical protein PODOV028v1_10028 [Vibrio phage PS32B.3]QZI86377.1 hypothetical protein PODOV029v1_10024 [Vibrio phage PS35B.1]QZI86436.1 hypothetical protein PODOV027v1_10027 [Vibrio phage PS35B.3]QZI92208.1 hypothetical protein PODOV026v1_p0035 [Vibrio phage PS32B.1]QZI92251.1 hypothetical protein PODOV004v1_p0016 [Vibrio phage PS32B.11]QZI92332.1 hypothetical protein PODOV025v1_p0035 [Vibrio phage PS32B.6]